MKKVVVIGGGWAGCSAAWELAKKGWQVTLIEKSKNLGGRAGSSFHQKPALELDCGQHLFLGAYEHSLRFLSELGTQDQIHFESRLKVCFLTSRGPQLFHAAALPGPLGLASALWSFSLFSRDERRQVLLFGLKTWRGLFSPASLGDLSARTWLEQSGQSAGLIRKFWEPLCLAALNAASHQAPASLLAVVLKKGFLKGGKASALGFSLKPLSQLLQPALPARLKELGSEVRLGTGAVSVANDARFVSLESGEQIGCDAVVLALTPWLAAKQFDDALADKLGLKDAAKIEASPILTAHLFTERPFLPEPLCAFAPEEGDSGFEFHWAFDRSALSGERGPAGTGGVWNCFVSSAARRMAGMSADAILTELKRQLLRQVKSFDPEGVTQALVLKEARATPLFEPGAARLSARTPLPNLALAGDWTDTGLPATIEGAVLSGVLAATVLDSERKSAPGMTLVLPNERRRSDWDEAFAGMAVKQLDANNAMRQC